MFIHFDKMLRLYFFVTGGGGIILPSPQFLFLVFSIIPELQLGLTIFLKKNYLKTPAMPLKINKYQVSYYIIFPFLLEY